jgi:crotonobetainyl-CoA:carnitine CoA-transferase CaiB-like acyl-CoA transferase
MQEAVAATTEHVNTTYNYEGAPAVRCGFRHGGQFVATWRCKDGYASITTNTQKAWDDLRAWMAEDGMVGDLMEETYNNRFILRGEQSAHMEALIESWALTHTRREITARGQARHHPWGPVATPEELLHNPQLWDRGFFVKLEHPALDASLTYPGAPYILSRSPWKLRSPAPRVGEHNQDLYRGELGLDGEGLQELMDAGVI